MSFKTNNYCFACKSIVTKKEFNARKKLCHVHANEVRTVYKIETKSEGNFRTKTMYKKGERKLTIEEMFNDY